jgi:predicted ribosome quality control (RQC) complex YloA/Tae2 family protein
MSFDGVFTRAMVKELNRDLENGRISKVYQPFQHEIILTIRANRKNKRVLLSAHPSYARIQVINDNLSNPDSAPNFCMVLRKNLEGAYIEDIKQLGNDRIIIFSFRNFDELGDQRQMELIIELMGRHSNTRLFFRLARMVRIISC